MNLFQRALAQLREYWAALSPARRVAVLSLGLLGTVAILALGYLYLGSNYRLLYADLSPEEASAVVAKLDELNIPHRLDKTGTIVSVPEDRVVRTRITLAGLGLPVKGSKGLEIFDESSLGMTPFVQNVNFVRGLQGDLARSISQLEPIASARVIIARSDPTPFVRDQKPTTASVVLKLKPNASLNRSAAAAITSLVSRSVEGLKPEHITIVDTSGRLLSAPQGNDQGDLANGPFEHRRDLEHYLAAKAEDVLSRHLGPGRAVVSVSADVNSQRVKERIEQVSPGGVIAERSTNTKSTGGSVARGPVGAASNVSRGGGSSSGGSGSNLTEEKTETDYILSKSVRELEDRFGSIKRLTVAALVDLSDPSDGKTALALADVQEIIKQAVGFQSGRDEIKVADAKLNLPLPLTETSDDAARIQEVQAYVSLARNISLGVAVAALSAMMLLFVFRGRSRSLPPPPKPALTTIEHREEERARLVSQAKEDPERVARTIRSLIGATGE